MKKLTIILLIAVIIPVSLFAKVIDLSFGVDAKYRPGVAEIAQEPESFKFKGTDIIPGMAADAKIFIVNANVTADLQKFESDAKAGSLKFSGFAGAGLSFDIFFLRLGLGAGYSYKFGLDYNEANEANWEFKFAKRVGDTGYNPLLTEKSWVDFTDFKNATMDLRLSADIVLGKLSAGAYVLVPTGISFNGFDFETVKNDYMTYLQAAEGGVRVMWHLI